MTDATLTIILNSIPTTIGAILAGVGSIYAAKALNKGRENGVKADVAAVKADEIHAITGDNLPGLTKMVERHDVVLSQLDKDVNALTTIVNVVRDRQHDITNYFHSIGLNFELRKIPPAVALQVTLQTEPGEKGDAPKEEQS